MSPIAIIDVGSTSVGGAILVLNKEKRVQGKYRVIYTTRERINFSERIKSQEFFTQMSAALKRVLGGFTAGGYAPQMVHCFLSAPFYAGQTRVIHYNTAKPTKISRSLIDDLIKTELQHFEAEHGDQHQLIENRLLSTKLNGYTISRPYGQMATELELINYFSLGSVKILDRLRETIAGTFHHRAIVFHTMAQTYYEVWRQIMPEHDSYLLFDIGGEVTELSVVSRGLLWETLSFPLGENYIIRQVAKTLKTTLPEAYSTIKRQVLSEHHELVSGQLATISANLKVEWLAACRQALAQASSGCFLPDRAWLIGNRDLVPLFGEWLDGESLDMLMMSDRKLAVDYWRADWFLPWLEHDAKTRQDLSLMAEVIYCDNIESK